MRTNRQNCSILIAALGVAGVVACGLPPDQREEIPGLVSDEIPAFLLGKADTGNPPLPLPPSLPPLPEVNPKTMLPAHMTPAEAALAPSDGRPSGDDPRDTHPLYAYTAAPTSPGKLPGEFEPVQLMVTSFAYAPPELLPFFAQFVGNAVSYVPTIVFVNSNAEASQLHYALQDIGADPTQVIFSRLEVDTVWMRDFGPLVTDGNGGFRAVDFRYYYGRWADDAVPTQLASRWGIPVSRPPLDLEGGNFQSDGAGTCIATEWLVEQNAFRGYTTSDVRNVLQQYLGCQNTLILPRLDGEGTGHVDMYVTITGPKEAIVGRYATSDDRTNAAIADKGAQMLTSAGFTVRRIPMPSNADGAFRSYTNSLAIGNAVLVPVYTDDSRYETQALAVFKQAYPGRTIIPIDSTAIIQWAGAVHCVTMTVAK